MPICRREGLLSRDFLGTPNIIIHPTRQSVSGDATRPLRAGDDERSKDQSSRCLLNKAK
jgi:hypothetical protein